MEQTTNYIKAFFTAPANHDPKMARLRSYINKLEKERDAAKASLDMMRIRSLDMQDGWSDCLSRLHDAAVHRRAQQTSLAHSEHIIHALAQERQERFSREQQNDQMLGAFRARYLMYKEQYDEQDETIKGLRNDLRKAQEDNRMLQRDLLERADRCLRLSDDVNETRMERLSALRMIEIERSEAREAQKVLAVENERLRAEIEELRTEKKRTDGKKESDDAGK